MSPVNKIPQFILPDDLEPIYANVARISHTQAEIILDFLRMLPGQSSPVVKSRLILSPLGAKLLLRVLGENLSRYEANYGEIRLPGDTTGLVNELFRSIHPPDKPPQNPDDKLDEQ